MSAPLMPSFQEFLRERRAEGQEVTDTPVPVALLASQFRRWCALNGRMQTRQVMDVKRLCDVAGLHTERGFQERPGGRGRHVWYVSIRPPADTD